MTKRSDEGPGAPETPAQALERAGRHARVAAAESVAALEALLDAACLAAAGEPGRRALPPVAAALAELRRLLAEPGAPGGDRLIAALLEAIEGEIARWEQRGGEDPDARAVLRAFLGMREILWEIGVRAPRQGEPSSRRKPPREPRPRPRKTRLQRVKVEG